MKFICTLPGKAEAGLYVILNFTLEFGELSAVTEKEDISQF